MEFIKLNEASNIPVKLNQILTTKEFEATILEGELENDIECHYPVYIHQLMTEEYAGIMPIWARNEIDTNKYSRWKTPGSASDGNEYESAGAYTPLSPGMTVFVKFRSQGLDSGYITRVKTNYGKYDKRDGTYLINKTRGGSYIVQNDNTQITHIKNAKGVTNVTLDKTKVALTVHKKVLDQNVLLNALEVDQTGTKLKFGKHNSITLDDSGIVLQVKDNYIRIGENGIEIVSQETVNVVADKSLNLRGNQTKLNGIEKIDIHTNDLKMTGEQMCAMNGMTVAIDSSHTTYLRSSIYLMLSSMTHVGIHSQSSLDIRSLMNFHLTSQMTTVAGSTLTLSGPITNLNTGSLFIDGAIMHNMGSASASASATIASNESIKLGLEAGGMGSSIALGLNSFANGIVASSMNSVIPGTAIPVGEILKYVPPSYAAGIDTKQKILYLETADKEFAKNVQHQFINLRNTHELV